MNTTAHHAKILQLATEIAELRLPPADIADLRYFFNEFEADIGIHSLHFAQFDALLGFHGTASHWHEPEVEPRACAARKRACRVSRTLRSMINQGESLSVTVLYRMYGPCPPGVRWDAFREWAPIAEYTQVVGTLAERMTRMLRMQIHSHALESLAPLDLWAQDRVAIGVRENVSCREAITVRLARRPLRKTSMTHAEFARVRQEAKSAQEEFVRTVMKQADELLVSASRAYRLAHDRAA